MIELPQQRAVADWCVRRPELLAFFDTTNRLGLPVAIFSASLLEALGGRKADDLDLLARNDPTVFEQIAEVLPEGKITREKLVQVCNEGGRLEYYVDELNGRLDGREAQVMRPLTKIAVESGASCEIELTPLAESNEFKHLALSRGKLVQVRFAHPLETILLKSLLNRGEEQGKSDFNDACYLQKVTPPNPEYQRQRLPETGLHLHQPALLFMAYAGLTMSFESFGRENFRDFVAA